jgi:hypothetical protein
MDLVPGGGKLAANATGELSTSAASCALQREGEIEGMTGKRHLSCPSPDGGNHGARACCKLTASAPTPAWNCSLMKAAMALGLSAKRRSQLLNYQYNTIVIAF